MPTLTLTIELPEAVYNDALHFAPAERSRIAAAAFVAARMIEDDEWTSEEEPDRETNEADLIAIGEGLADMKAGRTRSGEEVFAEMRERISKWTVAMPTFVAASGYSLPRRFVPTNKFAD